MRLPRELRWGAPSLATALGLTVVVGLYHAPLPGDLRLTRELQAQDWFEPVAPWVNYLGGPAHWLVLGVFASAVSIFALVRRTPALSGLLVLSVAVLLRPGADILKDIVDSPRPDPGFGVRVDHVRDSGGFPSGHVYVDVLFYGAMAWVAASTGGRSAARIAWPAFFIVAVLAGPARVYVGAHWPSDVVGGYFWGATALMIAITGGRLLHRRSRRDRVSQPDGLSRSAHDG